MNQDLKDQPGSSGFVSSGAAPPEEHLADPGVATANADELAFEDGHNGDAQPVPGDAESASDKSTDPVAEIAALQAKVDSHWDKLLRSNAELDNLRKRSQRELENAHRYALERFVAELLPVKDSLEFGLDAASQTHAELAGVREGLELTLKMFSSALEKFAVEEINPGHEVFNPELHQAMTAQEDPEHESGSVISVVQKGYRLNQRLVRPALVIVAK